MGVDITTVLLLLIFGPIVFFLGWQWPFTVLSGLVLLLPFRDLSIRVLNAFTNIPISTVNSLSRWWFVTILALLGVWAVKWIRSIYLQKKIPKPGLLDILLGVLLVLGLIEAFLSPDQLAGITSLRGYLQPLAVFLLARYFIPQNEKELRVLHIGLLIVGALLFIMAIWQFTSWTEETYRQWGYVDQIGRITGLYRALEELGLGPGFIRPASTVSGPNELGSIMLILFFFTLQWILTGPSKSRPYLILLSVVFMVTLALTNSRSVFVGIIASAVVFGIYILRNFKTRLRKTNRRIGMSIGLSFILSLVVIVLVMSVTGMLDIVKWTLEHPLADAHIVESIQAIKDIWRMPEGVGMGMVWPKGAAILQNTEALYRVEGSLFQIMFEWGIWGFTIWMIFIGISLAKTWIQWEQNRSFHIRLQSGMAVLGWAGSLIVFVFLPLMQSINFMVLLWYILGLSVGLEQAGEGFDGPNNTPENPAVV